MAELRHRADGDDDGGVPVRCAICGGQAAGPCARCRRPVCGDCCVLSEGGVRTWALCLGCERRGGRSLAGPWVRVVGWVLGPVLAVLGLLLLLRLFA